MNKTLFAAAAALLVSASVASAQQVQTNRFDPSYGALSYGSQVNGKQANGQPLPGTVQWYLTPSTAITEGAEPGMEPYHNRD
ncbi:MAG: hypothetical protein U1E56_13305 [Bauldia sp.]